MLSVIDYHDFDIAIWFTTNKTIRKYNKKYRKKDVVTDILSFPFHENLKPGQKIVVKSDDDKNLGDIIISLEYAQSKTLEFKIEFKKHIKKLIAHGIAHLLNYDHHTEKEYKIMKNTEDSILN